MDHGAPVGEEAGDGPGRLFGTAATVAACVGFVLLGALNAFFGPSIPALRSRFGLAPAEASLALGVFFMGAVTGVLIAGALHPRTRSNHLLITAFLVMAAGALGFALAVNWPCALAASLLCGLGAGGVDYGLNYLFAIGFGVRGPAMLGILNANFGLGAVAGPLAISFVGARRYPLAFGASAVLLVVVAFFLRSVRTAPRVRTPSAAGGSSGRGRTLLMLVVPFLALYALQVCVETGVGAWEPTYLQSQSGHSAVYAANATSGFWLMLTLGRLLVAPMISRWSAPAIVTVCCIGTTVCPAFAPIQAVAPFAFAATGLFNAPVFPVALPWLDRAAPDVRWAGTGAILAANLGGMAAGPVSGLGIEWFGYVSVPWLLAGVSAVCVLLSWQLAGSTRRKPSEADTGVRPLTVG